MQATNAPHLRELPSTFEQEVAFAPVPALSALVLKHPLDLPWVVPKSTVCAKHLLVALSALRCILFSCRCARI